MIGILGGMGTQAGLDFCNKLTVINRGKIDQKYPSTLSKVLLTTLLREKLGFEEKKETPPTPERDWE